ncbi:Collagen alpha-1 XII chain [Taenia solium]|eukprot:TsM_000214600 transcript=TsM_000214600 gene=TsM_000214600
MSWKIRMCAANSKRGGYQTSGGLCAEVLKNNSIHIFWHDPPKTNTELYNVQVWETESNSISLNESVRTTNFKGLRFENLKAYTNYSIKVQAYQKNSWILLAFVTNHTFPERPDAPSFNGSTTDTVVITTPQDWLNFSYTAGAFTEKSHPHSNRPVVACNATTNACIFEGLQANTGYLFTLERCSRKRPLLCSQRSNQSAIFYTKPKEPQNLVLTNTTSRSISAYWIPPEPNAESISKYMVTVLSNSVPVKSINISAPSNQCVLEHLQPTTLYTVRIIACARDNDCGLPAEATAWTPPGEPRDLVLISVTNSSIVAKWMPPEGNTQSITKYIVTAVDAQGHSTPETVPSLSKQHTFARLQPTTLYTVSVIACARDNDCGLPAEATASTLPEDPRLMEQIRFITSIQVDLCSPQNS